MNKKIICMSIIGMFLLTSFAGLSVVGKQSVASTGTTITGYVYREEDNTPCQQIGVYAIDYDENSFATKTDVNGYYELNIEGDIGSLYLVCTYHCGFHNGLVYAPDISESLDFYLINLEGDNQYPPDFPLRPSGETDCKKFKSYTYTSDSYDPMGDDLYYFFDWGDGTDSGWLGPYILSDVPDVSHVWREDGEYDIQVLVKDEFDAESGWSLPLTVKVSGESSKAKSTLSSIILRFFDNYPLFSFIFKQFH